jgi:deoxyribonuclease IV
MRSEPTSPLPAGYATRPPARPNSMPSSCSSSQSSRAGGRSPTSPPRNATHSSLPPALPASSPASAHDSYLINLATADAVLHARSAAAFEGELRRCAALRIDYVVTHPGNATDGDVASGIARNADAVTRALEAVPGINVLFETTAGAGRVLGATFEELADLLHALPAALQPRAGVCLDTCHVWAAGYDLRRHYDDVMARFDDVIGLERIRMFHLNDSLGDLGSRRDRHAHIAAGALGDEPFRRLMLDDRFPAVPKILETPKDDDPVRADRANLARLRRYRAAPAHTR